jgi:hypothetical protein
MCVIGDVLHCKPGKVRQMVEKFRGISAALKDLVESGRREIDLSLPTHNGLPIHDRGIVESCPGLYFMGLLFLYSLSSALVGGVGRDAEHIVDHIVSMRRHQAEALVN